MTQCGVVRPLSEPRREHSVFSGGTMRLSRVLFKCASKTGVIRDE